uniref:Methyltransferase-like protein 5 n=2 Tax=Anopheles albimanus TaxID=7167 RepID=A0A182FB22_ANOAL
MTKKILEDIQIKKQLLQKGGNSTSVGFANLYTPSSVFSGPQPLENLSAGGTIYSKRGCLRIVGRRRMACIKLKTLEEYLQGVEDFDSPKVSLEQYITPPHIASQVLYAVQTKYGDLEGRTVLDLGCGTGMLSIGAAMLGAALVIGTEIDADAVKNFQDNCDEFELYNVDCLQADVLQLRGLWGGTRFDTVLMNPPFGTKNNAGIDMHFLRTGLELARGAVYSLHKTATRDHITCKTAEWGIKATVVAELRYNLALSYKFHRRRSVDIAVDFWRFIPSPSVPGTSEANMHPE